MRSTRNTSLDLARPMLVVLLEIMQTGDFLRGPRSLWCRALRSRNLFVWSLLLLVGLVGLIWGSSTQKLNSEVTGH